MEQICCQYDGTFPGFLTCVFHCRTHRVEPVEFFCDEEDCCSLYPTEIIPTDRAAAQRVYRSLEPRLGPAGAELVTRGFLTCLPQRELWLWQLLRLGYDRGPAAFQDLTHPVVGRVRKAVQHLDEEARLLTGSVCFSHQNGVLVGEIEPQNRVLPLLRPHFSGRYPAECFVLYDRTHREALFHRPGSSRILPVEDFTPAPLDGAWLEFQPDAPKDRSRATHSATVSAAASISSAVVSSPSVSRMDPRACSRDFPSASST